MTIPTPNSDESLVTSAYPFIGNFHKTLPHNEFGEVDPVAYRRFERICVGVEAGMPINFEEVPRGPLSHAAQTPFSREQNPCSTVRCSMTMTRESCAHRSISRSITLAIQPPGRQCFAAVWLMNSMARW